MSFLYNVLLALHVPPIERMKNKLKARTGKEDSGNSVAEHHHDLVINQGLEHRCPNLSPVLLNG